jgi:predicted Zn finger-like uncharacterized protein
LIIQCGKCLTRYHYDEERFGSAVVKKIRCTKCAEIFEIRNPSAPREEAAGRAPLVLSEDFTLDPTEMASEPRRRPVPAQAGSRAVDDLLSTIRGPLPPPTPPPLPSPAARPPSAANQSTGEFPPVGGSSERPMKLPDSYRLSLACIAGPDSGRIFEIDKAKVTIGRVNAEVVLSDTQCSRQHAMIEVMDEEAWLTDLGSTNGTFIGERRITRQPLDNRTEFDVGTTTLMFLRTRRD